ncbi:hypothetical protein [Paenibacillus lactis]|uniref:hypothetical protein n=1 Tax=Paenibacillus lactis TaxID=228574 RepID=UPI0036D07B05
MAYWRVREWSQASICCIQLGFNPWSHNGPLVLNYGPPALSRKGLPGCGSKGDGKVAAGFGQASIQHASNYASCAQGETHSVLGGLPPGSECEQGKWCPRAATREESEQASRARGPPPGVSPSRQVVPADRRQGGSPSKASCARGPRRVNKIAVWE